MAKYISEGAAVCLVTCTLGEEGEVLVDDLRAPGSRSTRRPRGTPAGRLKLAMEILGVTDFIGLAVTAATEIRHGVRRRGRAIARDVLREHFLDRGLRRAANELVPVIRDRRPQVLITYNEVGGYGHPDHIQAHRVACTPPSLRSRVLPQRPRKAMDGRSGVLVHHEQELDDRRHPGAAQAGDLETFKDFDPDGPLSSLMSDDADIAVEIDGTPGPRRRLPPCVPTPPRSRLTAHSSLALLGDMRWAREYYRLAAGVPLPQGEGWADDLFAGLS